MAGGMRMNDRQMKQAMKKMGIKQTSIDDVTEVIIRTKTNEIVIRGADVVCVEMGGSKSYQISGVETVRELGAAEEGGDLYLINGNMTKLADAGIFAADSGKEDSDEEVLEVEKQDGDQSGDDGTSDGENAIPKRNNRRGKLV